MVILTPESAIGFAGGILSFPIDIGYLAYRFIDTDSRYMRETERIRMARAIRFGLLNRENLKKTAEDILDAFNSHVDQGVRDKIYAKAASSVAGRFAANTIISGGVAKAIAQRSSLAIGLRGGLAGNLLLAGGMANRSIYTSERLRVYAPEIYNKLRPSNYDLLYFLLEPALSPFVRALHVRHAAGQGAFNTIIGMVEDEISKK